MSLSSPSSGAPDRAPIPSTLYRFRTTWGFTHLHWDGAAIVRIEPPHERAEPRGISVDASSPHPVRDIAAAMRAYFDGEAVELATRAEVERWLRAAGVSGFRLDTSLALFDVPRGVTVSYGQLAELAGRPRAARAAGSACAHNPLPVLIPCHRVVHAGAKPGAVGTYGAATGSEYKRALLELERAPHVVGDRA